MKDRLSSIPVSTASFRKRKILDPFFWQLSGSPFLLLDVKILVFDAFLVSSGYQALFSE
ncbi:zinc ribbon domain containing, 1, isoform CRA_b [Rattus norvegicus]|uniref:Zinc ribbon domain containing, 1, isoform CRA_b n=1 Tax=Rattus norvegicus TaxID=10116 RepID=A6KR77_RAT|nr:zinc ribbon domain containing, 1, isoform CRA_b [Rattus norvegicus]EDL84615.1 zinc ribbon domain containing, 1, isoform CRA_b [Rattus norvegicus]EDL84616.1 zinc ribbon domain containing, 1, isoform CRA_b [Rattus norvegicus]